MSCLSGLLGLLILQEFVANFLLYSHIISYKSLSAFSCSSALPLLVDSDPWTVWSTVPPLRVAAKADARRLSLQKLQISASRDWASFSGSSGHSLHNAFPEKQHISESRLLVFDNCPIYDNDKTQVVRLARALLLERRMRSRQQDRIIQQCFLQESANLLALLHLADSGGVRTHVNLKHSSKDQVMGLEWFRSRTAVSCAVYESITS